MTPEQRSEHRVKPRTPPPQHSIAPPGPHESNGDVEEEAWGTAVHTVVVVGSGGSSLSGDNSIPRPSESPIVEANLGNTVQLRCVGRIIGNLLSCGLLCVGFLSLSSRPDGVIAVSKARTAQVDIQHVGLRFFTV